MREIRKIECSYLYDYVYILVFKNHPVEYMNTYRLETQLESALSSNATVIGEYLIYTFFCWQLDFSPESRVATEIWKTTLKVVMEMLEFLTDFRVNLKE